MMHWLTHLFGQTASRKERTAKKAENHVDRLEDQGIEQQQRLDAATKRVNKAVEQVRRVEQIAKDRR